MILYEILVLIVQSEGLEVITRPCKPQPTLHTITVALTPHDGWRPTHPSTGMTFWITEYQVPQHSVFFRLRTHEVANHEKIIMKENHGATMLESVAMTTLGGRGRGPSRDHNGPIRSWTYITSMTTCHMFILFI